MLKLSTARSKVIFMALASDHVAGATGLTLTITASKDGAAFASITPTVTELATGWYKLALTTSHTDTLGDLALHITGAASDPTDVVWQVVSELPGVLAAATIQATWDALTSALTTAGSIGKLFVDNLNATVSSRSSHSAADVWAVGTRTLTSFGTLVADVAAAVWGAATRILTAGTNIALAKGVGITGFNDIAAGEAMTLTSGQRVKLDASQPDYAPLLSSGYAAPPSVIQIRQEMDSNSTKLANLDGTITSRAPASTALSTAQWTNTRAGYLDYLDRFNTMIVLDGAVYQFTANALELGPSGGSPPSAAAIADAVWDEAMAGHLTAGSTGNKLNGAGGLAGAGAITYTYTVTSSAGGAPIPGADVWVSTDAAGSNVIAGTLVTDAFGVVTFFLDAGTYYFWRARSGFTFINPDTEVVA